MKQTTISGGSFNLYGAENINKCMDSMFNKEPPAKEPNPGKGKTL